MEQIELFKLSPPKAEPKSGLTGEFLKKLIAETAEMLLIANRLFPDSNYQKLQDVPTKNIRVIRSEYNRINNLPPPPWEQPEQQREPIRINPSIKPYRPWTLERKQRRRVQDLFKRGQKKYSFPDLWIEWVQSQLLLNPHYYGVCPLPGSCNSCKIVLPDPDQERAIALEKQLREIESGKSQPVRIPVKLATPKLVGRTLIDKAD